MFDSNSILIKPLVDGNLSGQEPFCIDGEWHNWGDMTPLLKQRVLKRKVTVSGASNKEEHENFWLEIAAKNQIELGPIL